MNAITLFICLLATQTSPWKTAGAVTVSGSTIDVRGGNAQYAEGLPSTFTVDFTVVPEKMVSAAIADVAGVRLTQEGRSLAFFNSKGRVDVGMLVIGRGTRISITVDPTNATIARDGRTLGAVRRTKDVNLVFGSGSSDMSHWQGRLTGVTVRALASGTQTLAVDVKPTTPAPTSPPSAAIPYAEAKLQLVLTSPVPDPVTVAPYKFALVMQEYKVLAVNLGHIPGVTPGATVRVVRWGISQGKKTAVANAKPGDQVTLRLERVSDHPTLERQFTIDKLPENVRAPFLVDTAPRD